MLAPKHTLSVIVPAYNVERYIEAAIDSLLAQSRPLHEIIVIDDGSTDGTAERLAPYARHRHLRVVRTPNRGLGPARNEGVSRATGEFVYFFDADDLLPPHFASTIGAALANGPLPDLLFFSGAAFADDGLPAEAAKAIRQDEFRRRVDGIFASGLDAAGVLQASGQFSPSACLYVSRRTLWNRGLRFAPVIHEDDEILMRLCARAGVTRILSPVLFLRRVRPGSIMSSRPSRRNMAGYFAALEANWSLLEQTTVPAHRAVLLVQFRAQAWQYLDACRRAALRPALPELAFLLARSRHIPRADCLRTLAPRFALACLRRGRALCTRLRACARPQPASSVDGRH